MDISEFDYQLPADLIADQPLEKRDSSRMLIVKNGSLIDSTISSIVEQFDRGDVLVLNNSKVLPSRLIIETGTSSAQVYLNKKIDENKWSAFAKPARKLKNNHIYKIAENFSLKIIDRLENGELIIEFFFEGNFFDHIEKYGTMPLPPYIEKTHKPTDYDKQRYQTVYAKLPGSVAAPTAGLHFTNELLNELNNKGVKICFVTLHVGAGTFLPIKTNDITKHVMHSEYASISAETAKIINHAKADGKRIFAVGTTSLRTIEGFASESGVLVEKSGEINLYIKPGYNFKIADVLLTNFHLPKSSLLVLVSAFSGHKLIMSAYDWAISKNYRFYSYGDCCLLFRG